ncbi:MAG: type II toxin-antitoxin system Phd/YefM family antitoxin [Polaromonas sp.]
MKTILANMSVSVTELKRNYADIMKQADNHPVAVLNHSRLEAFLVPAGHYERLMAYFEDIEDAKLVRERADGPFVEISLDEL